MALPIPRTSYLDALKKFFSIVIARQDKGKGGRSIVMSAVTARNSRNEMPYGSKQLLLLKFIKAGSRNTNAMQKQALKFYQEGKFIIMAVYPL